MAWERRVAVFQSPAKGIEVKLCGVSQRWALKAGAMECTTEVLTSFYGQSFCCYGLKFPSKKSGEESLELNYPRS